MKPLFALIILSISLVVANAAPEEKVARERLVIVSPTGFTLGAKRLTSVDDLKTELEIRVRIQPRFALLIVSGDKTPIGLMVMVLDTCRRSGVSDIKVEGAPAAQKEPNQSSEPTAPSGRGSP
jgi:hypothetical protein